MLSVWGGWWDKGVKKEPTMTNEGRQLVFDGDVYYQGYVTEVSPSNSVILKFTDHVSLLYLPLSQRAPLKPASQLHVSGAVHVPCTQPWEQMAVKEMDKTKHTNYTIYFQAPNI